MPVYILTIPGSEFTGVKAGVDFFHGKGSTSSIGDAHVLAQILKCGVAVVNIDGTVAAVNIRRTDAEHAAPSYAAVPVEPAELGAHQAGAGVEQSASAPGLSSDTAALKAAEDNPDSKWSRERVEADREKQKRGGRRRKQ